MKLIDLVKVINRYSHIKMTMMKSKKNIVKQQLPSSQSNLTKYGFDLTVGLKDAKMYRLLKSKRSASKLKLIKKRRRNKR